MAVIQVMQFRINPGGTEGAGAVGARISELVTKHGGSPRWFRTTIGGATGAGVTSLVMEFASSAEWGAFADASTADPEYGAIVAALQAADSPAEFLGSSFLSELTGGN